MRSLRVFGTTAALAALATSGLAAAPTAAAADAAGPGESRGYVLLDFQVDRYSPKTAAQAALVNKLDDDLRLQYREDKGLWHVNSWQFVTVAVPLDIYVNADDDVYFTYVTRAINKKTNSKVGDVYTTLSRGALDVTGVKAGKAVTIAWLLGENARPTKAKAWGPDHKTPQIFFSASSVK